MTTLAALLGVYAQLSLLAFGGGNSILPEMQRQVVAVHGWLTAREFAALYALAQAAPGPNMLVSTLIGWQVAGLPGALVATAGMTGPSCLLTFAVASLWHRFRDRDWRRTVQAGLLPVTVGLVMAGAWLLLRATSADWRLAAVSVAATTLFLFTRLHPLLVLATAATLGAAGLLA